MKIINKTKKTWVKDLYYALLFGALSYLLGLIQFSVPGLEGVATDLREVPLFIGILYISNPLFFIISCVLSALSNPPGGSIPVTFLSHVFPIIISWYVYTFIGTKIKSKFYLGIFWTSFIIFYYTALLFPLIGFFIQLFGLNEEKSIMQFYLFLVRSTHFEIFSSAFISTLYLIQHKTQQELREHKNNLEILVQKRTEELENANQELQSTNEELLDKSNIITEQNNELKVTLEKLKDTQAQLIQIEKMASLGTLTSGVAHEINNPLNFIAGAHTGLSTYFEKNKSVDMETTELLLDSIEQGVKKISSIVAGLNQFSRNNKSMDEVCDIHSILENCFVMLGNQFDNNIDIKKEYAKEPIYMLGNIGKLHQAFLNIFTNSVQAISKNGTIMTKTKVETNKAIIEIIDNGMGVDKKHRNQITDPFFTTKDPGENTGLGLSITASIINDHNGNIQFESEPDEGMKVTITLPVG